MSCNKIGPVFKTLNNICSGCLFFEKVSSFCRENEIFKNKKDKNLDQFLTSKRANLVKVV